MSEPKVQFCRLTPRGRGAIATILVSGDDATQIVQRNFKSISGKPIVDFELARIVYGHWMNANKRGEDLVICRLSEQEVEIHCHGGSEPSSVICDSLRQSGAAEVSRVESVNELHIAISNAKTRKTALLLVQQQRCHNSFWSQLNGEIKNRDRDRAIKRIDEMLAWKDYGLHLVQPWKVVLCGAPNVGKSSLINTILGFERAIVNETAGTTRDVLVHETAVDGWPIILTDTAGLRRTSEGIEAAGIDLAKSEIEKADLVIEVVDATEVGSLSSRDDLNPSIRAINKIDLVPGNKFASGIGSTTGATEVNVSALTRERIDELIQSIAAKLVPKLPPAGQAVPCSPADVEKLAQLRNQIANQDWESICNF